MPDPLRPSSTYLSDSRLSLAQNAQRLRENIERDVTALAEIETMIATLDRLVSASVRPTGAEQVDDPVRYPPGQGGF